ncbi:putative long-chain-alcohol O-fatty-acyltransferase 4 [Hordeum vulgare]|nr:putative long-chain-alcohol O-fatty-acyltransferase 4 [Hordeum vulgare]
MADSAGGARLLAGGAPRFFLILNRGQGSWGRSGGRRGLQEGWWEVGGEAASRRVQRALLLLGMGLEPQFDRPYLSASLRDFWGRRWNLSVPVVLRPCVYRPVRARLGPAAGVLAAFVVSGLVHELMFYPPGRTWLQVKTLGKFFAMSFSSGFFEWFYTGGKDCGFSSFPTLGLEARKQKYVPSEMSATFHISWLASLKFVNTPGSRFFFDFFPDQHWICTLLDTDCIMTGINALFFFFHVDIILDCYLFWTMELDLLDLEPVQILLQSLHHVTILHIMLLQYRLWSRHGAGGDMRYVELELARP